ncbi:type IV secretion system protein VirB10 [Novosphingobium sp. SG751A]|uniref:TrbI/VirB10 family protein n=1 Tax=Novosphingobium sp. SG751A TaxID=2587000 RepID=UPI00155615C8|nr:TrbI/VirB10 family protein [Novosphingobium sp. SG751A]NOW46931.1 type IV secretion system protein VirB10 [Novosphingobium sp. SG751A]
MREKGRDIRPKVAPPRDMLPLPVMLGVAGVLGLGLFVWMEGQRKAPPEPQAQLMLSVPPPPLVLPVDRAQVAPPHPVVLRRPARLLPLAPPPVAYMPPAAAYVPPVYISPAPVRPVANRDSALVVDNTAGAGPAVQGAKPEGSAPVDDTAHATLIRSRASTIPQGTIIAATLETPLNSDRPGLARAIISGDVRGFDGTRVLIPRGSRLIGEFKADSGAGKRRVMVVWNRLIRPDGVAIRIASPATDAMGGAGIAGRVDTHAIERLGSAVLQSALTLGVNVATAEVSRGGTSVYLGGTGQSLGQQLVPSVNRPATVKVGEGAVIAVLVAHDLDFAGTPGVR